MSPGTRLNPTWHLLSPEIFYSLTKSVGSRCIQKSLLKCCQQMRNLVLVSYFLFDSWRAFCADITPLKGQQPQLFWLIKKWPVPLTWSLKGSLPSEAATVRATLVFWCKNSLVLFGPLIHILGGFPWPNEKLLLNFTFASYFHKGLMWCGVKVEKSRKNGFSYDKAIFWQNL